jgi:hypothetical protein
MLTAPLAKAGLVKIERLKTSAVSNLECRREWRPESLGDLDRNAGAFRHATTLK